MRESQRKTPEVRTIEAWHEALNAADTDRLAALSHPDVEVGGPRGSGRGAELLRDWVERANITLRPLRFFQRAETVVVEGDAEWRDGGSGETTGSRTLGSVFAVRDGRVSRVIRYPDLASALRAAGLYEPQGTGTEERPRTEK